jgi:DNA-binding NarL/FixJ family response regulator
MSDLATPRDTSEGCRVLLVDDHPAIRHSLAELLRREASMEVVDAAGTGEEAVAKARLLRPDVVVIDHAMPGIGGLEAARRIRGADDAARVIVLTSDVAEESLFPVLAVGGSGFVRKVRCHRDLVPAIHAAARDGVYLYPDAVAMLLQAYRKQVLASGGAPGVALNSEEQRVCALTAAGYSPRSIGPKLGLSLHAVEEVCRTLMNKLDLHDRTRLVEFAFDAGLLPPG